MIIEHTYDRRGQRVNRLHGILQRTSKIRIGSLLLALTLAFPLAGCGVGRGDSTTDASRGPIPTPIDLESIPYETRLAQDIATLDGACAALTESLTVLDTDPAALDDPLWTIDLEADATEAWAATLVIMARETVPESWSELHAEMLEPTRAVNTAAERILYPEQDAPPRSPTSLLTLRPSFDETCRRLVDMAQPIVKDAAADGDETENG